MKPRRSGSANKTNKTNMFSNKTEFPIEVEVTLVATQMYLESFEITATLSNTTFYLRNQIIEKAQLSKEAILLMHIGNQMVTANKPFLADYLSLSDVLLATLDLSDSNSNEASNDTKGNPLNKIVLQCDVFSKET